MRSLNSQNKYPDCLWMQLEAIPLQSTTTEPPHIDIYLTLNFNEHWEPLLNGRLKFGLQGGTLKLKLENCELPLTSRQLTGSFNLFSPEKPSILETSLNPNQNPDAGNQLSTDKTDRKQITTCHIITTGSDINPAWVFTTEPGETILKGLLKSTKIGHFPTQPCRIQATFEVEKEDIHLIDIEGLWKHDITPNQHAILERILIIYLLETKLKPDLSWIQLCYDCANVEKNNTSIITEVKIEIQELIESIITAKTHNFMELCQIANLNPAIDFIGGNLRGTTFNGCDFSSANLYRVNFRGANLNDTDFSDANLSNAKFGGADLSGAFLGNADLSDADLHRASIALANLSGANLRGANLCETNLTNTNLSGADVTAARFKNNTGISEEMKDNLIQRGAIFAE
ncbi:hypothetical protein BCD67_09815 [Oscillatoriales cyanobacterium USR001]|nr:hypothetical protein BCD67_09815 [Oscillatoriales cyanobacterium USR001]